MLGKKQDIRSNLLRQEDISWDLQERDAGWCMPTTLSTMTPGRSDMINVGVLISRSRKVRRPISKKGIRCG